MSVLAAFSLPPTLLPALVFLAELCVVTCGTLRIIFVARGFKGLASVLGFFEVTLWLFAMSQIMQNLSDVTCYLAFAGGFCCGNYLGILIEQRLAIGTLLVRTITSREPEELVEGLRDAGYGLTTINGQGAKGPVKIVFTVVQRKQLEQVIALIKAFDPNAFYSVDEIQAAEAGVFPVAKERWKNPIPAMPMRLFQFWA